MINKKVIKWLIAYVEWGLEKRNINDVRSANKVLAELKSYLRKHELN